MATLFKRRMPPSVETQIEDLSITEMLSGRKILGLEALMGSALIIEIGQRKVPQTMQTEDLIETIVDIFKESDDLRKKSA